MSEPPVSAVPFLKALTELFGSDLHCKVGSPPRIRIDGSLRRLKLERDILKKATAFFAKEEGGRP